MKCIFTCPKCGYQIEWDNARESEPVCPRCTRKHNAVCQLNEVAHLLTFNISHFLRMAAFEPGVVVVNPATA